MDPDFAHAGRNVSVVIPSDVTMDMGSEIEALKMGFVPVKSLTTYVKSDERDLQIDFVTCRHRGPITVNAPPPDKYALHKLLVYGERPQAMRVKAAKDLDQAACLIDYLARHDAELLSQTWAALISRGPGWKRRAMGGLAAIKERYPEVDTAALPGRK